MNIPASDYHHHHHHHPRSTNERSKDEDVHNEDDDDDDEEEEEESGLSLNAIFQEPDGYYEKKDDRPTFQLVTLSLPAPSSSFFSSRSPHAPKEREEVVFSVRLLAQSPLWGHLLFPAGRYLAEYLAQHAADLVQDKAILELGAGSGLPSLVCAYCAARAVVLTDYPDADLLDNLRYNVEHCTTALSDAAKARITVMGHVWGSDTAALLAQIPPSSPLAKSGEEGDGDENGKRRFDTLILADLVFNHSEHASLVATVRRCLAYTRHARALVFFTPHRPWLYEADSAFFRLATQSGGDSGGSDDDDDDDASRALGMAKIVQDEQDKWTMFEEDKARDRVDHPDDARLRRTVFGYELFWRALQ